jgi:hypothetical protein
VGGAPLACREILRSRRAATASRGPLNADVRHRIRSIGLKLKGGTVRKVVTRISPWQTAKPLALTYFALGVLFALPIGLLSALTPAEPGQPKPGPVFFIFLPFLYALAGLIFVPLGCWIYNKAAAIVGGVEVIVEDKSDA